MPIKTPTAYVYIIIYQFLFFFCPLQYERCGFLHTAWPRNVQYENETENNRRGRLKKKHNINILHYYCVLSYSVLRLCPTPPPPHPQLRIKRKIFAVSARLQGANSILDYFFHESTDGNRKYLRIIMSLEKYRRFVDYRKIKTRYETRTNKLPFTVHSEFRYSPLYIYI